MLPLPEWKVCCYQRSVLFNHESESVMHASNIAIALFLVLVLFLLIGVAAMIVVALELRSMEFWDLFEDDEES